MSLSAPFQPTEMSTQLPEVQISNFGMEIISYELRVQIEFYLGIVMQALNIIALVANSLNISVFVKLGFAETSNVSLLALSVSDLIAAVLSIWNTICGVPAFKNLDLPFNPDSFTLYTGFGPWGIIVRSGAWITVYITFERCLCIMRPLKVKRFITIKSTVIYIGVVAIFTIWCMSIMYILWNIKWVYSPTRNRTILDVVTVTKPGYDIAHALAFFVNGMVAVALAFVLVVVCTIFLVVHLQRNSQWRKSAISGDQATKSEGADDTKKPALSKEERLVKMVIVIAVIFIICFTPNAVLLMLVPVLPEMSMYGDPDLYPVLFVITSIFQSINACANILVYYKMGTRFRNTLHEVLHLDTKKN